MYSKRIAFHFLAFLSLVSTSLCLAEKGPQQAEAIDAYLERLELSEDQESQFRETLAAQREERMEILESHGFQVNAGRSTNFKALRAASGDLKKLRSKTETRLSEFLTPDQLTEFREIQKELKGSFKKELKEKRKNRS